MPRTAPLYAGLLVAILVAAGLWAWVATRTLAASPAPAVAPVRSTAVGAFFERAGDQGKRQDPRKDDCDGCGGKKTEPEDGQRLAPLLPVNDALFAITGRSSAWKAPESTGGALDLAVGPVLEGRFIYWCGAPVGKVEGRWRYADSALMVTRVDADKDVAIVDGVQGTSTVPRRERCARAHTELGALVAALPRRLEAGGTVAACRVVACGGGRAVLVAEAVADRRFDDRQVCVDATGRPVQLNLTRAAVEGGALDAEHLICFVDAATGEPTP